MEVSGVPGAQYNIISGSYSITDLIQLGKRLGEATRLQIADVYTTSLDGVRTRRPEMILVRDLEYLRIYERETGKITASYPDSAPWFHLCPPHCLSIKGKDGRIRRLMWQAIASHNPSDSNELEGAALTIPGKSKPVEGKFLRCVIDHIEMDGSIVPGKQEARSVDTIGMVSCLESLMLNGKVFLLAVYKNGLLAAYTEDLRTANSPMADHMIGETVQYMITMNAERAKDGILATAKNIHATLDGSRLVVIVSQVLNEDNPRSLRIRVLQLSIRNSSPDRPTATVLLSQDIKLHQSMKSDLGCTIHDRGQLHVWNRRTIQIFDLSKNISQASWTLNFQSEITSVARLTQQSIAICTAGTFDQINLEFATSQGSFTWPEPLRPSEITKQYESKIISHDQKSGRLLCLYGSKIIAISTNQKVPTKIADFIDRGLNQTDVTAEYQVAAYQAHLSKNPRGEAKWQGWMSHVVSLSNCVKKNNTVGFDATFVKILEFITKSTIMEQLEVLSLTPSQRLNHDEKLSVVVSSIFEPIIDSKDEPWTFGIDVKILPEKTFNWLVRNGYVTSSAIEHSFRRLGKVSTEAVRPEAVVHALAANDIGLSHLQYFVTHSNTVNTAEATCAISYALGLDCQKSSTRILAITLGDEMDIDAEPKTEIRTRDPNIDGEDSALIKIALLRLIDKDHESIIKALRQHLTNQQLFTLIEYLRYEMSTQGWFIEVLHDNAYVASDHDNRQTISRIAKILGCILDALGMAPWLNSATSVETENLITWMKLEISAALEAVEEATYMSGILHEVSLFTKLLATQDHHTQQGSRRSEPITIDNGSPDQHALPAGLKPPGYIDTSIVRGGKVQKMSSRQIGHIKSRMVGAYSREKIDLNNLYQSPMNQNRQRK